MPARRTFPVAYAITLSILASGCSSLRPKSELPEYAAAKNAIESYEDSEGNYIRPEGAKADKRKATMFGKEFYVPWPGNKPREPDKAKQVYAQAEDLFKQAAAAEGEERQKLFIKAGKTFVLSGKYWTSSHLEQDAWFYAAESYFFAEDYPEAEEYYVKLFRDYPNTVHKDAIDRRRMQIAQYWIQYDRADPKGFYVLNFTDNKRPWNDTGRHGIRVLDKLRLDSPTGRLADDATMELAVAHFEKGKYEEAEAIFEDLRAAYPDSPHQFDAHFLGLKATLETYQGPEYDGQALTRADTLIKKIYRQFPEQAANQKEYLDKVYAEIVYKQAERLDYLANYRMKRGENRAAAVHLDRLLADKNMRATPYGEKALATRDQIKERPEIPSKHLQWLADLVPHNDKISQARATVEPIDANQVSDVGLDRNPADTESRIAEQSSAPEGSGRF